jgi:hypothetical protein
VRRATLKWWGERVIPKITPKYLWEKDSIRNTGEKETVITELTLKY